MIIAREKKDTNIAEYVIYMWQLEDILRALSLDMTLVKQHIVDKFEVSEDQKQEIYDWYDNLVQMMKNEKIEKSGHLQVIKNVINEMTEVHFYLLHEVHDMVYHGILTSCINNFVEFRKRTNVSDEISDVELALNGLYGVLMLRLQGKQAGEETTQAMESFSKVLAYISKKYKQLEEETE